MLSFKTQNPTTGEWLKEHSYESALRIDKKIENASVAFKKWKTASQTERQDFVLKISEALLLNKEKLAKSMALEMGKPLVEGRAEVEKCVFTCRYLVENYDGIFSAAEIEAHYRKTRLCYEPLGIILLIMPWNYPLWQVIRSAIPALLAGNVILLKHSDIVASTSEILCEIISSCSSAKDLFIDLKVDHANAEKMMSDFRIRGVSFTGSSAGGSRVAEIAGKNIKKTVLELGGSDAYIVLNDADLSFSAELCAKARLINNGQSCIAAKRFYIPVNCFDLWLDIFKREMSQIIAGNPIEENTRRGPLAALKFKKLLQQQLSTFQDSGANLLWSEKLNHDSFAFVPAQIFKCDLGNQWIGNNEIFAPVATVIAYKDEDEMVLSVNSSIYGLGAGIFSADIPRAQALAKKIDVGMVSINDSIRSDVRSPFGGVKNSGYGKELGISGCREFVNLKTIGVG